MATLRVAVVDTNVLVSGLLNAKNPPGRILDLILVGEIQLVCDDRIYLEYNQVLNRRRFGFQPTDVTDLLESIRFSSLWVNARPIVVNLPDPNDLPFLEIAVDTDSPLITGNTRHFPRPVIQKTGLQVFTPAKYLEKYIR